MAARNPPLDDSHQPFKRSKTLGPGPKKGGNSRTGEWECRKLKKYVQICEWVGPGKRSDKKVVTDPERKKKYNKLYAEWLDKKRKPRFPNKRAASYRCRARRKTGNAPPVACKKRS